MLLASDGHPEADARRITQRPEHRHLVVAEEHRGVRPVTRVAEGADTEHPVINQLADEHRVPAVGWIGAERFEGPLEVAVDVPDEEDRQVLGSRPRAVEEGGHRTMLTLPSAARGVAQPGQSIGLQNRGPRVRILPPLPLSSSNRVGRSTGYAVSTAKVEPMGKFPPEPADLEASRDKRVARRRLERLDEYV